MTPSLSLTLLLNLVFTTATVHSSTLTPSPYPSTSDTNSTSICVSHYKPPNIRYPPAPLTNHTTSNTLNTTNSNTSTWASPPQTYLYSPWHFTHSTRPRYRTLVNMQSIHYPILPNTQTFPVGSLIDLVSWSTSPNDTSDLSITTAFGYFKPVMTLNSTRVSAAWNYSSTGPLAATANMWAILAYGVDTEGVAYRVDYETGYRVRGGDVGDGKACVNIASRSVGGPSTGTYREIVAGLQGVGERFGDEVFVNLVGGLGPLKSDARGRKDWVLDCDEACVENAGLVPG